MLDLNISNELGPVLRNQLVDNFTIIEHALNGTPDNDLSKQLTDLKEELNNRMDSIILGTDDSAIELVVKKILKDEGVI